MKVFKQLAIIFLFSFLGEFVSFILPFSVPGSVTGMILMFLALHFKIVKLEDVDETGNWIVDNMALFFVPAGVGLMTNFHLLGDIWWQLLIIIFVTCALVMWLTGFVVQAIMKRRGKQVSKKEEAKANA